MASWLKHGALTTRPGSLKIAPSRRAITRRRPARVAPAAVSGLGPSWTPPAAVQRNRDHHASSLMSSFTSCISGSGGCESPAAKGAGEDDCLAVTGRTWQDNVTVAISARSPVHTNYDSVNNWFCWIDVRSIVLYASSCNN